jgi:hypothetical protein
VDGGSASPTTDPASPTTDPATTDPASPTTDPASPTTDTDPAAGDRLEVRPDVGSAAWISCAGHLPFGQPDDQRATTPGRWSTTGRWIGSWRSLAIRG